MLRLMGILFMLQSAGLAMGTPLDKTISVEAQGGSEFVQICLVLQVPCAIEIDDDRIAAIVHSGFSIKDKTGTAILRLAMKRYPNHKFIYEHGLLRVYPAAVSPQNPLDFPLGKIVFVNQRLEDLGGRLVKGGKFRSPGILATGGRPASSHRTFSFTINSATARETLNAAVIHHGHAAWITRHRTNALGSFTNLELFDYDLRSSVINAAQ